jgi:tRNA A-37 threonylcarbamoyl transferase component Bud32
MNYNHIENLNYAEIKQISEEMGFKVRRNKEEMLKEIVNGLKEYETYKKNKIDKYTKIKQLGKKGKEGVTYLVKTKNGNEYAMKTFRKQKSTDKLNNEIKLQHLAAKAGVSPNIIDYDTVSKYIVMDKMDRHLTDIINKQEGLLTKIQQKQIISIYKKLDDINVFHGDANLLNYMFFGKQLYIIDFGMAKEITNLLIKKLGTSTPNVHIMTLGLVLKLKEMNCNPESYSYLSKFLSEDQIKQFAL